MSQHRPFDETELVSPVDFFLAYGEDCPERSSEGIQDPNRETPEETARKEEERKINQGFLWEND